MSEDLQDHAEIQWAERETVYTSPDCVLGQVPYANPPKTFTLRGVEYNSLRMSLRKKGGDTDGEEWHLATRVDEGDDGLAVWVSETYPGEFVRVFIPRDQAEGLIEGG